MIKLYFALIVLFCSVVVSAQTAYINEINYLGADSGIEIKGTTGLDLSGWSLYFYEGTNKKVYKVTDLTGVLPNDNDNQGIIWFPISTISKGHPKGAGIALVDNYGNVVEFLSYGGSFVAKEGPVANMGSQDIGIVESNSNNGKSLQKDESGKWVGPTEYSPGKSNSNKTLGINETQIAGFAMYPNPVANGKFSISSNINSTKQVEIYSLLGKRVYNKNVRTNEVMNVSNLIKGIYILRVEEEGKIATRKLVVN